MQEKIEKIIRETLFLWDEPDDPREWILDGFKGATTEITKLITAEIAKLFEREVIWEGEAVIQHSFLDGDYSCPITLVTMPDGEFEIAHHHKDKDSQRVRVIVEDIE